MGCIIMDLCCPIFCPRFRPPFALRVVLVKARKLEAAAAGRSIYVEVLAGDNPAKTTSLQRYHDEPGLEYVVWNEPVDLLIEPSMTHLAISVYSKGLLGDSLVGSVQVPIDGIHEPRGACHQCPCFGSYDFWPSLWARVQMARYEWPLVRGTPDDREWYRPAARMACLRCCGLCDKPAQRVKTYTHLLTKVPEQHAAPGGRASESSSPGARSRREAARLVARNGLHLQYLSERLKADRQIVALAVHQNGDALRFASPALRQDLELQRIAAKVPEPFVLQLHHHGKPAGRLFAYFVLRSLDDLEEGLVEQGHLHFDGH